MYSNENTMPWAHKQNHCAQLDGGVLAEQSGPIVQISVEELEVLGETLEALRGRDREDEEFGGHWEPSTETQICRAAARLASRVNSETSEVESFLQRLLIMHDNASLDSESLRLEFQAFEAKGREPLSGNGVLVFASSVEEPKWDRFDLDAEETSFLRKALQAFHTVKNPLSKSAVIRDFILFKEFVEAFAKDELTSEFFKSRIPMYELRERIFAECGDFSDEVCQAPVKNDGYLVSVGGPFWKLKAHEIETLYWVLDTMHDDEPSPEDELFIGLLGHVEGRLLDQEASATRIKEYEAKCTLRKLGVDVRQMRKPDGAVTTTHQASAASGA